MGSFVELPSGLLVPESVTAVPRASVYVDESGNSGPNYIDLPQPFYVLAGWLVPADREVDVAVAIDRFRQKRFPKRKVELKADAVLRNDRTKGWCVELFLELGQLDCVPMYLIAEKRYCVAGKIVETFLDPAYHKFLRNAFITDIETKQEIANTLYERLPDSVIVQFAEAYRAPTAQALKRALLDVMAAVEANVSPELAKAIGGSRDFIDEIAQVEAETSPLGDVAGTLNMPCLVSFLMLVENLGRLGLARPIKVLHDEQHQYGEGYRRIFQMHRGMPRIFAKLPHTNVPFSNLQHVAEFEISDSKISMPIQAADLLAGVLLHCCKLALSGEKPEPGDHALAETVLPALLVPEPKLTWIVCSDRMMAALGKHVFEPAIRSIHNLPPKVESGRKHDSPPAPLFPVKGSAIAPTEGTHRIRFDLPMFAFEANDGRGLMIVNDDDATDEPMRRYLLLFTTREFAANALQKWEMIGLDRPQQVSTFGPGELPRFITLLEQAARTTDFIGFDQWTPGPLRMTPLREFLDGIKGIFSRMLRTFRTGMDKVLLEKHQFGTVEVFSMQGKDGQYGAMIQPGGKIYFADSRQKAIEALRSAEGI